MAERIYNGLKERKDNIINNKDIDDLHLVFVNEGLRGLIHPDNKTYCIVFFRTFCRKCKKDFVAYSYDSDPDYSPVMSISYAKDKDEQILCNECNESRIIRL